MKSILLRLARMVLESVLKQLAQQLNRVLEQALNPIQQMIQQVVGGIWIGDGADAFVNEVSQLVVPGVTKSGNHISTLSTNLQSARDIIERADEEADRLVKTRLYDAFNFYH